MSVLSQIVVESRRYSGWIDARYPIGYWQATRSVIGDATGGVLAIDLVFQIVGDGTLNSQMYSVERFAIRTSDATDRVARISTTNMGGPSNSGFSPQYAVPLLALSAGEAAAEASQTSALLPWFLGSQRTGGITASLSVAIFNPNLIVLNFEAEGYRWSPRSVLVDGGPQRPPTGLYRA